MLGKNESEKGVGEGRVCKMEKGSKEEAGKGEEAGGRTKVRKAAGKKG